VANKAMPSCLSHPKAGAVNNLDEAAGFLNQPLSPGMLETQEKYPLLVSDYYLNLIDRDNPVGDPIWKQCMPDPAELDDISAVEDPLAEAEQSPVSRLIRRYQDRAVLLTTNRCATYCRFCFRKRFWKKEVAPSDITDSEFEKILEYLRATPEVKEILVSGGDPLMLSTSRLNTIVGQLTEVPSVEIIRVCSRMPVTLPSRIDQELADMLSKYQGLWFVTHFNHPNELTIESLRACDLLVKAGIPMLNQTVLLKGVNDNSETLERLFRTLVGKRIKPHYLFHVDPVKGVRHFSTGIEKGLQILRELRPKLSSLATPTFAIDLPEGGGKVQLQPNYFKDDSFEALDGHLVKYP
jgi:lysine 2,3-aminomutase